MPPRRLCQADSEEHGRTIAPKSALGSPEIRRCEQMRHRENHYRSPGPPSFRYTVRVGWACD
eukprot:6959085-Pyramimonas_sp.AAC.1